MTNISNVHFAPIPANYCRCIICTTAVYDSNVESSAAWNIHFPMDGLDEQKHLHCFENKSTLLWIIHSSISLWCQVYFIRHTLHLSSTCHVECVRSEMGTLELCCIFDDETISPVLLTSTMHSYMDKQNTDSVTCEYCMICEYEWCSLDVVQWKLARKERRTMNVSMKLVLSYSARTKHKENYQSNPSGITKMLNCSYIKMWHTRTMQDLQSGVQSMQ